MLWIEKVRFIETCKSRNLLFKLSTPTCTYMTSKRNQTSWRKMKSLPFSHCGFVIIAFLVVMCGLFLYTFATCSQTPWWVYTKFLTCIAFHITMCRLTMWSHMHEPISTNFPRWSKLHFICMCPSSCECKLLNFYTPINHHQKVNVHCWKWLVHTNLWWNLYKLILDWLQYKKINLKNFHGK